MQSVSVALVLSCQRGCVTARDSALVELKTDAFKRGLLVHGGLARGTISEELVIG
jgi:hypothetical protein